MLRAIVISFVILAFQAWSGYSQCVEMQNMKDTMLKNYTTAKERSPYRKCWTIKVPEQHSIDFSFKIMEFYYTDCRYATLIIRLNESKYSENCRMSPIPKPIKIIRDGPITIEVELFVDSPQFSAGNKFSFEFSYDISSRLSKILGIQGVAETRKNAIEWLKSKHTPFWGWKEDTPKAVTALFLSGGANFNGIMLEEMMAKQTELRTALAITWNTVTNQQLSTFINGLLVTCLKPRRFYGHDLVKRLKDKVESSGNFTHPAAYLALCNVNETWPLRSTTDLSNILSSDSDYPFVRDIQAFAIMALSCMSGRTNFLNKVENAGLKSLYTKSISRIKSYQQIDGSFGNAHTTFLLTQALLSSDKTTIQGWNMPATMHYLMKELKDSSVDFLTVYTALPILNGKSLSDIAAINCSANPRRHGDGDLVSEMNDYLGPKIRVQYSLYVGDEKDVIHTISLRVPQNVSAYKVMQLAEAQDPKYQFKVKTVSGKMYVYEIAKIPNDPEDGNFWLLHLKLKNTGDSVTHSTLNPDQILLDDGEELIMWYKTAQI